MVSLSRRLFHDMIKMIHTQSEKTCRERKQGVGELGHFRVSGKFVTIKSSAESQLFINLNLSLAAHTRLRPIGFVLQILVTA